MRDGSVCGAQLHLAPGELLHASLDRRQLAGGERRGRRDRRGDDAPRLADQGIVLGGDRRQDREAAPFREEQGEVQNLPARRGRQATARRPCAGARRPRPGCPRPGPPARRWPARRRRPARAATRRRSRREWRPRKRLPRSAGRRRCAASVGPSLAVDGAIGEELLDEASLAGLGHRLAHDLAGREQRQVGHLGAEIGEGAVAFGDDIGGRPARAAAPAPSRVAAISASRSSCADFWAAATSAWASRRACGHRPGRARPRPHRDPCEPARRRPAPGRCGLCAGPGCWRSDRTRTARSGPGTR